MQVPLKKHYMCKNYIEFIATTDLVIIIIYLQKKLLYNRRQIAFEMYLVARKNK